ncbi:MAG: 6,7-dimethyl-8-ribityllumazine synthase [Actinomycetota bacterium]|nr:6,7-dimethyl-8-ribityllumazine synthase [Actinomycetota bacterium]
MTTVYEGSFDARDLRVAIVASRFNETITKRLVEGALDCFERHGVPSDKTTVAWVPGAFEIPAVARRLAASGQVDAIVCVGVVIRGETAHFDYVAGQAMNGIGALQAELDIPVTAGVLTTETTEQAADRAGGKMGNKGFESALAAIEMANLFALLPKPDRSA